jgi:hypothetical protein
LNFFHAFDNFAYGAQVDALAQSMQATSASLIRFVVHSRGGMGRIMQPLLNTAVMSLHSLCSIQDSTGVICLNCSSEVRIMIPSLPLFVSRDLESSSGHQNRFLLFFHLCTMYLFVTSIAVLLLSFHYAYFAVIFSFYASGMSMWLLNSRRRILQIMGLLFPLIGVNLAYIALVASK